MNYSKLPEGSWGDPESIFLGASWNRSRTGNLPEKLFNLNLRVKRINYKVFRGPRRENEIQIHGDHRPWDLPSSSLPHSLWQNCYERWWHYKYYTSYELPWTISPLAEQTLGDVLTSFPLGATQTSSSYRFRFQERTTGIPSSVVQSLRGGRDDT